MFFDSKHCFSKCLCHENLPLWPFLFGTICEILILLLHWLMTIGLLVCFFGGSMGAGDDGEFLLKKCPKKPGEF